MELTQHIIDATVSQSDTTYRACVEAVGEFVKRRW